MTTELAAVRSLARLLGVHAAFVDGLGNHVDVSVDTLVAVCRALGADLDGPGQAPRAVESWTRAHPAGAPSSTVVAWDGRLSEADREELGGEILVLADGTERSLVDHPDRDDPIPTGRHRLVSRAGSPPTDRTLLSAPRLTWRPSDGRRSGVAVHLAALRARRSRSVGDLRDLETLGRALSGAGADLVTVLPLLPTFNTLPVEPSPYSPVSRLFWSELILDLGEHHVPVPPPASLDVHRADAEVRAALRERRLDPEEEISPELRDYARFRGAQMRLGRNWIRWPSSARSGRLTPEDVDPEEEAFHLLAQVTARRQLADLSTRMGQLTPTAVRLGLDLSVGVHPDGYDVWSRQSLFADGMSVGAPPDPGFPSGQNWGFPPVLPDASRSDGHDWFSASVAHQARVAGVLRIDHVMALNRLFWIPEGAEVRDGTYVDYPMEELLAVLSIESHLHRCEIIGENLGTVPDGIRTALPRHGIRGMHLAIFQADDAVPSPPDEDEVALTVTHDTPTLAGWLLGGDIDERVRHGLLAPEAAGPERERRTAAAARLIEATGATETTPEAVLPAILEWLGRSPAPLVVAWFEDLWYEARQVNLPGTSSSQRGNWQRPMGRLLDDLLDDPEVSGHLRRFVEARSAPEPER